ncbi:MAG: hypothetical protein Ct9H300mP28_15630 [Pseudomonadota bacterium]|nr:MAG: hypothetical protein Ct9H300mP28_15630 [Pseudomonadota bacterium]
MFSDTVENNIRFSEAINESESPNTSVKSFFPAAMEEEVGRFPEQEKTMVGEKGIMLSVDKTENQPGKGYVETLQPADSG